MIRLPMQAIRDMAKAAQALDASEVIIDPDRDLAHLWSADKGAALSVKLWQKKDAGAGVPMDRIDETLGEPGQPFAGVVRSTVAMIPGMDFSPMVRSALADLAERRRLAGMSGTKDKSVEVEISEGRVRVGQVYAECRTWGPAASSIVNGGYLMACIDHAFGMVAHAVHLEIHESGTVRVMMQSPNELNEPDTRWRGQGVVGPIVVRDRLEGLRKAGNDAARA